MPARTEAEAFLKENKVLSNTTKIELNDIGTEKQEPHCTSCRDFHMDETLL